MKSLERGKRYDADGIRVYYNPRLCIHAAECVRGLPDVFDPQQRPWIQPGNADPDVLADVIGRCPTGALSFDRLDGGPAETPSPAAFDFVPDGPAYVRGQITVQSANGETVLETTRIALCRCGASQHKPFCDGAHHRSGFTGPGLRLEPRD